MAKSEEYRLIGRPAPSRPAVLTMVVRTRWRILPRVPGKSDQHLRNFCLQGDTTSRRSPTKITNCRLMIRRIDAVHRGAG